MNYRREKWRSDPKEVDEVRVKVEDSIGIIV